MNFPFSSELSSKEIDIIKTRYENLLPTYVLEETLSLGYIKDKPLFIDQFLFTSSIYQQIKRSSGETYIQHPLRMLTILNRLGFKSQDLSSITYGHDIIEILRDYHQLFPNYSNKRRTVRRKYKNLYPHIQLLTPPKKESETKIMQLEKILLDSSNISNVEIPFIPWFLEEYRYFKTPIRLSIPLTVIAKILDVVDNCYDQALYKPEGISDKENQIKRLKTFVNKSPSILTLGNKFIGFPKNLKSILNEMLDNAEYNLYHPPTKLKKDSILLTN